MSEKYITIALPIRAAGFLAGLIDAQIALVLTEDAGTPERLRVVASDLEELEEIQRAINSAVAEQLQ